MKNCNKNKWKLLSFGTAAVMLAHLIVLCISMVRYSAFPGAAWYQDSNKMILLVLYGVPVIMITALTAVFFAAKNDSTEKIFCLIKFGIVFPVDFFIFVYMLLFYHNPTTKEFLLLVVSCGTVAIVATLIFVFEIVMMRQLKNSGR